MSHYERYTWIINNIMAYLREENNSEDRMKYINYIIESILKRCLDAKLLSNEQSCERCNNA